MVEGSGAAGLVAVGMQSSYAAIQATNMATARKIAMMSYSVELEHDGISTVQAEICKTTRVRSLKL